MELEQVPRRGLRLRAPRTAAPADDRHPAAPGELWEAIEAREVMERALAQLAAFRRTEADLSRLHAALAQMRRAGDDRDAFAAGDFTFHVALSDAAHNALLAARLATLHDRVREMIALYTETAFREGRVDVLLDAHARLADAVGRQDADAAPLIMSEMMARLRERAGALTGTSPVQTTGATAGPSKGESP